jgi:hypothetical protein
MKYVEKRTGKKRRARTDGVWGKEAFLPFFSGILCRKGSARNERILPGKAD